MADKDETSVHSLTEQRLQELEMRVAFQEDTIGALNEVVVALREQIDRIELNLAQLRERLANSGVVDVDNAENVDERPPHY